MDRDLDGLVLQQARYAEERLARAGGGDHAAEADARHALIARRPLHHEWVDGTVALTGHNHVQRVDFARREQHLRPLAHSELRLLHHHRGRRRQATCGRRLDRSLARRERYDVAALIDARHIRSERREGDRERRRRGAVVSQGAGRNPRVLGRQEIDDPGLEPERGSGTAAWRLPQIGIRAGRRGRSCRGGSWRRRWLGRTTATCHLDGGLPPARAYPGLDDGHAVADTGDGTVVVDLRNVDVFRGPDDADRGDHVADAIEGGGEQAAAFPDPNRDGGRRDLDFRDVLRRRRTGDNKGEYCDESASNHGSRMCVRLNAVVKPTCHSGARFGTPKTRYPVSLAR